MNTQIIRPPAFQKPSGRLNLSAEQSNLVSSVGTLVNLDVIPAVFTDGIENIVTHRITPGRAGFYSIVGMVRFIGTVDCTAYNCSIKVSGVEVCDNQNQAGESGSLSTLCVLPNFYLSASDYVELWATSFAGGDTVDIDSTNERTYLALQRVR